MAAIIKFIMVLTVVFGSAHVAYGWVDKMFLTQEYGRLDSTFGDTAPNLCNDENAGWKRILGPSSDYYCRDYIALVPTSVHYDPASVERWRDANYPSWCGLWIEQKYEKVKWCETDNYVRLMPESSSYIGDEARKEWLRENKRFKYACYSSDGKNDGCGPFLFNPQALVRWQDYKPGAGS